MLSRPRVFIGAAIIAVLLGVSSATYAQVIYPRASQKQSIEQTVGDTEVRIVYHRPHLLKRSAFGVEGAVVPYGKVWRAGANEATLFEFSSDITIDGHPLPKGKYSFYVIPKEGDWTVIFNKSWNQWGTTYNESDDALRFDVTPVASEDQVWSLTYSVEDVTPSTARIVLSWDKVRVPFVIDVGDVNGRVIAAARREMVNEPVNAANFVLARKILSSYEEALKWLESSLSFRESYGALLARSRLLGELGRKEEAISTGERALEVGKAANVNQGSLNFLESLIKTWKSED